MKHEYHMICLHWKYVNMSIRESPAKHSKIGKFPMSWKGASIFGRSSNGTISLHTEDHQGNAMSAVVPSTCTHMIHESTMLYFSTLGCPFCSLMWVNDCNRSFSALRAPSSRRSHRKPLALNQQATRMLKTRDSGFKMTSQNLMKQKWWTSLPAPINMDICGHTRRSLSMYLIYPYNISCKKLWCLYSFGKKCHV